MKRDLGNALRTTFKRASMQAIAGSVLALTLALNGVLPVAAQEPATDSIYQIGQCRSANPATVREEIEAAAHAALDENTSTLDVEDIVKRKWAEVGADAVVDAEIARAVQELAAEESYWQRLWSAWSADKAEEFAQRIAESAFGSEAFATMINNLSYAIGAEIAANVEAQLDRAASAGLLCLRDYAGEAYGSTLLTAFEEGASAQVIQAQVQPTAADIVISPLNQHQMGLTGAGIIVAAEVSRRVATKLSEKIAGRVAGKVAGRILGRAGASFIPVAGWVVGIGLIVWDLYEGGKGALPQIEEALTGEDVKQRIRNDVADAVRSGLPEEGALAAMEISVNLLDQWGAFCGLYGDLCALADENASFHNLLESTELANLGKVSALVTLFVNEVGRNELTVALETGDFDRLRDLPSAAVDVLRTTRSVGETLAWADLAGSRLEEVVWYGLPASTTTTGLSVDRLNRLLDLANPVSVSKVLSLSQEDRANLLELPIDTLKQVVEYSTQEELQRLLDDAQLPHVALTPFPEVALAYAGGKTLEQIEATPTPVVVAALPTFGGAGLTPTGDATPASLPTGASLDAALALATNAAFAVPPAAGPEPWTLGILGVSLLALALASVLFVAGRKR